MAKPQPLVFHVAIAILLSILCVDLACFWLILEIYHTRNFYALDLTSISLKLGFILLGVYRWHRQETDPAQDRHGDQPRAPESPFANSLTINVVYCLIVLLSLLRSWFSTTRRQGPVLAVVSCMLGFSLCVFHPSLAPHFGSMIPEPPGDREGTNGRLSVRSIIFHLKTFLRTLIQSIPTLALNPASLILVFLIARYYNVRKPIRLREVIIVFSMTGVSLISACLCLPCGWPIKPFARTEFFKVIFLVFQITIALLAFACKPGPDIPHALLLYQFMIFAYSVACCMVCAISLLREDRPTEKLEAINPRIEWNLSVLICLTLISTSIMSGITGIDMHRFQRATEALSQFQSAHCAAPTGLINLNEDCHVGDKSLVDILSHSNDESPHVATTIIQNVERGLTSILTNADLMADQDENSHYQLAASIDSLSLELEPHYDQTVIPEDHQFSTNLLSRLKPITGHASDLASFTHFNVSGPEFQCLRDLKQVQMDANEVAKSLNDRDLNDKATKFTSQGVHYKQFKPPRYQGQNGIGRNIYDILTGIFFQQYAKITQFLKSYKKFNDNRTCVNSLKKLATCSDQPDQYSQCNKHRDDFLHGFDEFVVEVKTVYIVQWIPVGFMVVTIALYLQYFGQNAFNPAYRVSYKNVCVKTCQFFLGDKYHFIEEILGCLLNAFPIDYAVALFASLLSIIQAYWTPVPTITAFILTIVIGCTIPHAPKPVADNADNEEPRSPQ